MKIAVICINYAFYASPTVKGICSYLIDRGIELEIYADSKPPSNLIDNRPVNVFHISKSLNLLNKLYLKSKLEAYDWIICVEYLALNFVSKIIGNPSHFVYLSLEGVQIIANYKENIQEVRESISKCGIRIIQSKERAKDLNKYLNLNLDFELLPVSLRPRQLKNRNPGDKNNYPLKIIYSGYFATWACLTEFLQAIIDQEELNNNLRITLQGAQAENDYYKSVGLLSAKINNISVDNLYYEDQDLMDLLENNDLGLALYKDPGFSVDVSTNWQNLIFSSGKIASYLWAGLGVITNIDHPMTKSAPFLYIHEITSNAIENAIGHYLESDVDYRAAALACARKNYNLDLFMQKVLIKINKV